jgi:hypothetical protein
MPMVYHQFYVKIFDKLSEKADDKAQLEGNLSSLRPTDMLKLNLKRKWKSAIICFDKRR